jgi:hypothetical protein
MQVQQYQKRLGEEVQNKKELEAGLEGRLNDTKRHLEMKQREIDLLSQKLSLPVDTDILRMKIIKDVESRHRIDLEGKASENERLQDNLFETKR